MKERKFVEVDSLGVLESYRGKGVGKLLQEEVESWAKSVGINEMELHVWDFNASAIGFYTKNGYQMASHRMRKVFEE